MTSAFNSIIATGLTSIRQITGVEVEYRRGDASVTLTATVGQRDHDVMDSRGLVTRVRQRDYLIAVDDLILDGSPTEPKRGDLIVQVTGARVETFEVIGKGQPDWAYSDAGESTYRIHTQRIDVEEVSP